MLGLAIVLVRLSIQLIKAGRYDEAIRKADQASGIFLSRGANREQMLALLLLGMSLSSANRFVEAADSLQRALDLARDLKKQDVERVILAQFYALYLIQMDRDKAAEFYKRAIEVGSKDDRDVGKDAGTLLALGRRASGLAMLDRAIDLSDAPLSQRVECWFYAFAHRAPERRGEALAQLKHLIVKEGARSSGWDFSGNVERARSDGHPDAEWLSLLADVISKNTDPAVLQDWPAWAAA